MSLLRRIEPLVVLAFLVVAVMCWARLGTLPFRDPDEGRNAEVGREMHESGSWLVPTYNGVVVLDKPAFFFRAVGISNALFGENQTAARLPSALFATLLLAMLFVFCRREYPERGTAALAVMITASSPLFIALARHVIFDMTLAFFVSGAIFSAYLAESSTGKIRRYWYLAGAALAGMATLVKGPVGFIIPLLVIVFFHYFDGRRGWARRAFSPGNILVFLAVVLPWFIGLSWQRPDFPYYGLIEESFHRFTTSSSFHRSGPFYYYGLVTAGGFFAWNVLFPEAALLAWRRRLRLSSADRLFIVWTVVVILFFSFSQSKLPAYILSVSVPLGALTARLFMAALIRPHGPSARLIFRGLFSLMVVSGLAALFLSLGVLDPSLYNRWGFHGTEFNRLTPLMAPAARVFFFIALLAALARWRRHLWLAFTTFLLVPILLLTAEFDALARYSESSSSRQIGLAIRHLAPHQPVVCYECFPCGLPFYLREPVHLVTTDGREFPSNYALFTLRKNSVWPEMFLSASAWPRWRDAQTKPFILLLNQERLLQLPLIVGTGHPVPQEVAPGWWALPITPPAMPESH